jgi:hypothetical protein
MVLSQSRSLLVAAAAIAGLSAVGCQSAVAQSRAQPQLALSSEEPRPNRIQFEYVAPKDPRHEHVYKHVKEGLALERVQQLFSPFRLPVDLTVRTIGCDGRSNAWYLGSVVNLCYEYLDQIWHSATPEETTAAGITRIDAVVGQFFYVVLHEFGHAMFDLLRVPSFGSAEDAADQFSTYMMLHMGKDDARRLIAGAAFSYRNSVQSSASIVPLIAFTDMHGLPAQRFYNLLCIAYGADPTAFAYVAAKYLPEDRAHYCKREYDAVTFAFTTLIVPHLDDGLTKQILNKEWLPPQSAEALFFD